MSTNKENHVALWNWMAETCAEHKHEWPGFAAYKDLGESFNSCFACAEAKVRQDAAVAASENSDLEGYPICCWCPLDWGSGNTCTCLTTPFCDWIKAHAVRDSAAIKTAATKIRDMKWRDE